MRFTRFSAKAFLFLGLRPKFYNVFGKSGFPGSVQQVVNHRHNFYIVPVGNCHQVANILVGKLSNFSMVVGLAALILNMNNAVEESCPVLFAKDVKSLGGWDLPQGCRIPVLLFRPASAVNIAGDDASRNPAFSSVVRRTWYQLLLKPITGALHRLSCE